MNTTRIKELRQQAKITQEEIGNYVGVSKQAIGLYENNKREPDIITLIKLADFFGVTVDYLIRHSDDYGNSYNNADSYTTDEKKLINAVRKLAPELKEIVINTVSAMEKINANRIEATNPNTKKA